MKDYTKLLSFLIDHFSEIFPNHSSETFTLLTGLDYLDQAPSLSSNGISLPTTPRGDLGSPSPRGPKREASSVDKKMKTKQIDALIEGFEIAVRDRDTLIDKLSAKNSEQEGRLLECDSRLAMLIDELKAKEEEIAMLEERVVERDDRILELEGDLDSAVEEEKRVAGELESCERALGKVSEELGGKIEELDESKAARAAERAEFESERALLEGFSFSFPFFSFFFFFFPFFPFFSFFSFSPPFPYRALEESEKNCDDLREENDSQSTQITSLDSQLASSQQSLQSATEAHQVSFFFHSVFLFSLVSFLSYFSL